MASKLYKPFFQEGLLYLPDTLLDLLIESGCDADLAQQAAHGLHLDEDRDVIDALNQYLETILDTLDPAIQEQLQSQDVIFMLSHTFGNDEVVCA